MESTDQWISNKLKEIAERLPSLVHQDPASFACGFNSGYKQCLIDLSSQIDKIKRNIPLYQDD